MDTQQIVALLISGPVAAVGLGAGALGVLLAFEGPAVAIALEASAVIACLMTPVISAHLARRILKS